MATRDQISHRLTVAYCAAYERGTADIFAAQLSERAISLLAILHEVAGRKHVQSLIAQALPRPEPVRPYLVINNQPAA